MENAERASAARRLQEDRNGRRKSKDIIGPMTRVNDFAKVEQARDKKGLTKGRMWCNGKHEERQSERQ